MKKTTKQFIIVDDDPFSNFLSKTVLLKLYGEVVIKDFLVPELALDYIKKEYEFSKAKEKIILLLDINMPTITGWEFLDLFKDYPVSVQNLFQVYILSSSIDPVDIERAKQNPLVMGFIEKPLNRGVLVELLEGNG
ncbi:MAG: response regulator [Flavobacterium sp.]|nr:response regulator [Flavobacterium sp.]